MFEETVCAEWPPGAGAWLAAWLLPGEEAASAACSRPSAMPGAVRRNRLRVTAARLLNRLAGLLVTPVDGGPSPCCRNAFLAPHAAVPGLLSCSGDGRFYAGQGKAP
jgi:hypothetical protein